MKKSLVLTEPIPLTRVARGVFYVALIFIFVFSHSISYSQNSANITATFKRIQQQQVVADSYFLKGIFPSYISKSPRYSEKQKDNNVFYNALIGYTLSSLKSNLSDSDKLIVDSIQIQNQLVYQNFKNAKGRNTYNFSRTDTAFTFPYNNWIPKLRGDLAFPDDLDCTALILMSQNAPDSVVKQTHELMQLYTNKGKLKTTFKSYRKSGAYSSWFGKKFPVVFDVSVLCNVLCFVQQNKLEWTKADSASLQLIVQTIHQKDHLKHPLFVSPYYGKTSIVLYHLARLMSIKPIAELEVLKPEFAEEAKKQIQHSKSSLEKIMLNSALLKWGYQPVDLPFNSYDDLAKGVYKNDFSFFVGNIPSYKRQPTKEILTDLKSLQYYYYCNAFNDALLLEYLVLLNNRR